MLYDEFNRVMVSHEFAKEYIKGTVATPECHHSSPEQKHCMKNLIGLWFLMNLLRNISKAL